MVSAELKCVPSRYLHPSALRDLCVLEEFSAPEVSFRGSGTFRTTMRRREDVPFNGKRVSLLGQTAQPGPQSDGVKFGQRGREIWMLRRCQPSSSSGARLGGLRATTWSKSIPLEALAGFSDSPRTRHEP